MHDTSLLKVRIFAETYLAPSATKPLSVLDVGSKSYEGQPSYKEFFPAENYVYTGLDLEPGLNVDIVPTDAFVWRELETSSFDACVSGQTFEHNPFFWVTFAEIARVLRPSGLAFIVAPGSGHVHRYPWDCWRFYPDSWASLCAFTGMELVESYFEPDGHVHRTPGAAWRDSVCIARKPLLTGIELDQFHQRLAKIIAPMVDGAPRSPVAAASGDWTARYNSEFDRQFPRTSKTELKRALKSYTKLRI